MNCPRCQRTLLREHDAGYCLIHGTVIEPARRAWDLVDVPPRQTIYDHDERCQGCGIPTYRTSWCVACADRVRARPGKRLRLPEP